MNWMSKQQAGIMASYADTVIVGNAGGGNSLVRCENVV
jgi:hypothetical protein